MLLKSQDETREKKMEIELSVLSESTQWQHKLIDRVTCDKMTVVAQEAIENEDDEMNWFVLLLNCLIIFSKLHSSVSKFVPIIICCLIVYILLS